MVGVVNGEGFLALAVGSTVYALAACNLAFVRLGGNGDGLYACVGSVDCAVVDGIGVASGEGERACRKYARSRNRCGGNAVASDLVGTAGCRKRSRSVMAP